MKEAPEEENERQLKLIHKLSRRLPWIIVGTIAFAVIAIIIQAFLTLK